MVLNDWPGSENNASRDGHQRLESFAQSYSQSLQQADCKENHNLLCGVPDL
jgi:hypothetical protein